MRTPHSAPRPGRPAQRGPSAPALAPAAPTRITESLRASIEHAYEYHASEPGLSLREIIDRICLEFGLDRQTVNEVASRVHSERLKQQSADLNDEQRRAIYERYEGMVTAGLRPAHGRRRMLAREFGVSLNAVTSAVNHWGWRHGDPRQVSRKIKFEVERQFWHLMEEDAQDAGAAGEGGRPALQEAVRLVADRVEQPLFTVARWVDQLFDDPRLLDHISLPPPPVRTQIEQDYIRYLEAPLPPDESLHRMLADRHGCTVRQAHFTLLLFRWRHRLDRLESTVEEKEMVATAEQNARSSLGASTPP